MLKLSALLATAALSLPIAALSVPQAIQQDSPPQERATVDEPMEMDAYFRMQFFATIEGLYNSSVPNDVVDRFLVPDPKKPELSLFVTGCPICIPVKAAMRVYRARAPILEFKSPGGTFGKGFPAADREAVLSGDYTRQHAILQKLVSEWTEARLKSMRLTPEELERWHRDAFERRKKGMGLLPGARQTGTYGPAKACAACDGANSLWDQPENR
ncbi:MAG: hypothetical protein JNJ88_18855 [Planctomycetes bacterium]|nr:hypothetical protein [Planctomycetota bacterium]